MIKNLLKETGRNIASAWKTDGVKRALAKRALTGAGIGAAAGGTIEAVRGGSFGDGAAQGAKTGAMIGAASGVYKMGAFGSNTLNGKSFRKGASVVYADSIAGIDQVAEQTMRKADITVNKTAAKKDINAQVGKAVTSSGTTRDGIRRSRRRRMQ